MIGLADDDEDQQIRAIHDAFALGRKDARPLLLVRRSILSFRDNALAHAIRILNLGLIVSHGDIWWTPSNWIDQRVRSRLAPELGEWTRREASRLLALPEAEEWSRGGLGQDVAALIGSGWGPDVEELLQQVAAVEPFEAAWPALLLLLDAAGDEGLEVLERVAGRSFALRSSPLVQELRVGLREHGSVDMW